MLTLFDALETEEFKWFRDYHEQNPQIYELFRRYTLRSIERGFTHFSAEFIFNVLRWETAVTAGDDDFKINNNAKPYYSRLFEREFPQYAGFFRKRASKADSQFKEIM